MVPIESLHTHTTLSDGKLTHRELFELCQSFGLSVVAFTDHDAVPPQIVLDELESLRPRSTKWVIGIEITAGLPKELIPEVGVMHILGLFIDPKNPALIKHCVQAQKARVIRMEKIVKNLQNLGFKITKEDCLEMSGGESVGRPHIARAITKYPENNIVMEKLRREMAAEAEHNPEIQKKYEYMMQRGEDNYPYVLFLTPDSFRKGYEEYDYMPDLDEAVKIIRDAGGVAILAHYYTIEPKMPLPALEKIISEKRLDGAEVIYGLGLYGTNKEQEIDDQRQSLRELMIKYKAIALGGSDAHSKEDLHRYAMSGWFSNESVGFAEKILASGKVNKKFSSFE